MQGSSVHTTQQSARISVHEKHTTQYKNVVVFIVPETWSWPLSNIVGGLLEGSRITAAQSDELS